MKIIIVKPNVLIRNHGEYTKCFLAEDTYEIDIDKRISEYLNVFWEQRKTTSLSKFMSDNPFSQFLQEQIQEGKR